MNISNEKMVTFLLADDHSLIRQGVEFIIEEAGLKTQVFHASNLQQVLKIVETQHIDIVIIDAIFPDGNSITVIPEIKKINSAIKILVFSGINENTQSLKYINAGANGFLSKLCEEGEIKNAILKIHIEGKYLSPVIQALLMASFNGEEPANPLLRLTEREMQIAEMYSKGYGNLEIANFFDVKQNTISTIKKRLFEKLEIENLVELIEMMKDYQ